MVTPLTHRHSWRRCWTRFGAVRLSGVSTPSWTWPLGWDAEMTAFALRRNEIRLAADLLARAEAWFEQGAPELQADIARIRGLLLLRADRLMDRPVGGVRPN